MPSLPAVTAEVAFKLVEDKVAFVQIAQLGTQVLVDLNGLHRLAFHVNIPNLESQIVAGKDVAAITTELTITDGGNNFREERTSRRVLRLLEVFGMLVTKRVLSGIVQLDGSLAATIHEEITVVGVEGSRSNYFREFFHVGRLDVNDVKALIRNLHVPQVNAEVVS